MLCRLEGGKGLGAEHAAHRVFMADSAIVSAYMQWRIPTGQLTAATREFATNFWDLRHDLRHFNVWL